MIHQPGQIFVTHSPGFLGRLIRCGERMSSSRHYAYWNHAGIVVDEAGGTIEAAAKGVVRNHVEAHLDRLMLPVPARVDLARVVEFATAELGVEYGYWDDVLLGIDCLTGLRLHAGVGSWICSELAASALEHGGWGSPKPAALMMPSDIAWALTP